MPIAFFDKVLLFCYNIFQSPEKGENILQRADDLILSGWTVYQHKDKFRFGTDAVLLYHMIPRNCGRTVDLCSGGGAVALLLLAGGKTDKVTAVEIQSQGCELARKSARKNGAEDRLEVICGDICKISEFLSEGVFDTVCVNPPYFKKGSGILPPDESVAVSRHELMCTVEDVFYAASYLLKPGGNFYMVHRIDRQNEILNKIKKYNLFPTQLHHIFSKPDHPSKLFLLAAQKGAKNAECKHFNFTVMNTDGSLSENYKKIYEE